jgi:hypothetical protein
VDLGSHETWISVSKILEDVLTSEFNATVSISVHFGYPGVENTIGIL